MKYIQQDNINPKGDDELSNTFIKKNVLDIHASNSYLSNNNVPNFESNVADISKFYNINYDNLNENQLKQASQNIIKNVEESKRTGRESIEQPDYWEYKNELPMNGGGMGGIYGFDELESQYATFDKNKVSQTNQFNNIPKNDLRKPVVYNN